MEIRHHYLDLSITLSILVGALCIVGGLLRLGAIANFLSRPVLVGFLNGMALIIISGQLGKLCGFAVRSDTGLFSADCRFRLEAPTDPFSNSDRRDFHTRTYLRGGEARTSAAKRTGRSLRWNCNDGRLGLREMGGNNIGLGSGGIFRPHLPAQFYF